MILANVDEVWKLSVAQRVRHDDANDQYATRWSANADSNPTPQRGIHVRTYSAIAVVLTRHTNGSEIANLSIPFMFLNNKYSNPKPNSHQKQ